MAGFDSVRAEVATCLAHFTAALGIPGHAAAYAEAIAPAAWNAFPNGTMFHCPERFAEVIAFHVIKAAGLPLDQAAFRKASLVGEMPMHQRHWLLHYAVHLPPALRVASREPSPEAWLSRIPPGPAVDEARRILAGEVALLARMRPRMRAGACVVAAWKRLGLTKGEGGSLQAILEAAGIGMASAYNAAVRVGLIFPRTARLKGTSSTAAVA